MRGKRILVVGLGRSGVSAASLLLGLGARVRVTEKRARGEVQKELSALPRGIPLETGSHTWLKDKRLEAVILSPGVPWDLPGLRTPRRREVPILNELGLGLALSRPKAIAAITGTNGKTTTTALLAHMMRAGRIPAVEAGNTGTPLTSVVRHVTRETVLLLEVSSYQLEGLDRFRPQVGCVLNVTPDHLARHRTMERYARIKFRLFKNQRIEDVAVLNADDPWCRRLSEGCPGGVIWVSATRELPGYLFANSKGLSVDALPWAPLRLPRPRRLLGPHNMLNALFAAASALSLGVPPKAVARSLKTFKGVPHRLQAIARKEGVLYVNDSKATNVHSTAVALAALPAPILLILGGEDKGAPYTPLIPLIRHKVKAILLIGEAAPKIRRELIGSAPLEGCGTLDRALERASRLAREGDVVLLSPACASFDQFRNFEHRGQVFEELVRAL